MERHASRIISGILCVALTCGLLGCGGNNGTPDAAMQAGLARNVEVQKRVEQWISQTEPFVRVNPDGTLRLDLTRAHSLSAEAIAFAETAIAATNERVKAGELTVDENLVVRPMNPTRANENGVRFYWWGYRIALDNTNTQRLIAVLNAGSGVAAIVAALTAALGPEALPAAALAGVSSGILQIGGGVLGWYAAPGRGVFIHRTWVVNLTWIQSQPR